LRPLELGGRRLGQGAQVPRRAPGPDQAQLGRRTEGLRRRPGDGALLLAKGLLGRGRHYEEKQGKEGVEKATDGGADAGDSHRTFSFCPSPGRQLKMSNAKPVVHIRSTGVVSREISGSAA